MEQLKSLTEGFLQNQIIPLAATVIIMGVIIVGFSFMVGTGEENTFYGW